ncbi:MAG: RNA recognition motif domain-containing protein [Verrucomicrobiales bacterium]
MSYNTREESRHRRGRHRPRSGQSQSRDPIRTPRAIEKEPARPSFLQKLLAFFGLGSPIWNGQRNPNASKPAKPAGPSKAREAKPPRQPRPPVTHEVTSPRLYVGNLSFEASESDLFGLFSGVGRVHMTEVVCHRHNQRSKGFAFVEMASLEEAKRAVEELNEKEFMGRKLLVSGARPGGRLSESNPQAGSHESSSRREQPAPDRTSGKPSPVEDTASAPSQEEPPPVTQAAL